MEKFRTRGNIWVLLMFQAVCCFFWSFFFFSNIVIGLMFVCILTCQGYIGKEKQLEKNPTDRRLAAVVCLICALVS